MHWPLIKIAARNIFRNKRRTLITLFILLLGSTGLILVGGFFEGLLFMLREGYIRAGTGHVQINKSGYSTKGSTQPFEHTVENFSRLKQVVQKNPNINYIFPDLKFGGMLTNDENSMPVLVMGIDPEVESTLITNEYYGHIKGKEWLRIVTGMPLDSGDPYGILIGEDLRKAMGLNVGDSIYFITTQQMGAIEGAEFHIRGVYESAVKDLGERLIKIPLQTAQKIWAVPDQIHSANLHLNNTEATYEVAAQLGNMPELKDWDLEIIPWDKQSTMYLQTDLFLRRIYLVLQVIIGVIIFFSIANTINMNLLERIKEYGTMMAIGCNRSTVFSVIITEAVMVGIIGGTCGVLFAVLAAKIISSSGLSIPPPPLVPSDFRLMLLIKWDPVLLRQAFAVCFSSTVLAAILPALRAVRFRIVQALGYV